MKNAADYFPLTTDSRTGLIWGVVGDFLLANIDTTSRQLKQALEDGKTIIVTTLQKFPVISKDMGEMPGMAVLQQLVQRLYALRQLLPQIQPVEVSHWNPLHFDP